MATLTITPPFTVPLAPSLGGTGVANADTLTLTGGAFTISDTGAVGFLTLIGPSTQLAIAHGKTFEAANSLTLAGTDGTTMTFPGSSTTVAGLSIAQTFTAVQTITGTPGGTGNLYINTSATTANALVYLLNSTGALSGNGITMDLGRVSGATFTGKFLSLNLNGAENFSVSSAGNVVAAGSLAVGGSNVFDSSGFLLQAGVGVGGATGTATLGRVPAGQTTTAQTGWIAGIKVSGSQVRVPYWLDT